MSNSVGGKLRIMVLTFLLKYEHKKKERFNTFYMFRKNNFWRYTIFFRLFALCSYIRLVFCIRYVPFNSISSDSNNF